SRLWVFWSPSVTALYRYLTPWGSTAFQPVSPPVVVSSQNQPSVCFRVLNRRSNSARETGRPSIQRLEPFIRVDDIAEFRFRAEPFPPPSVGGSVASKPERDFELNPIWGTGHDRRRT